MPKPTEVKVMFDSKGATVVMRKLIRNGKKTIARTRIDGSPKDQSFKDALAKAYDEAIAS